MPDQDYAVLLAFLCVVLLIAVVIPAPARAPRHEADLHLTLLGTGAALAILAGVLALAHLPVHSAFCGSLAWLTVMPCVWMARGPEPAEGYGAEEDEDDDGGEPWPRRPGTPPSPDGLRPGLAPSAPAGAQVAWARPVVRSSTAPRHAVASHETPPSAAVASTASPALSAPSAPSTALSPSAPLVPSAPTTPPPASAAERPAATRPRRLKPRPRRARGEHRSIIHKCAAEPHLGRRRRASLRRRILRRCRMLLWVEAPECVTFVEPEHDQLRPRPARSEAHPTAHV